MYSHSRFIIQLGVRHTNATYEYSLKGRWPEERYKALLEALQDVLSLLSQLSHVMTQLDKPWRQALLQRTRLSDANFLADVLAVISMCSGSLRAGLPIPQITPGPLVAKFRLGKIRGIDLPTDLSDALPSIVTPETLESDEYMKYALGVSTTFSVPAQFSHLSLDAAV